MMLSVFTNKKDVFFALWLSAFLCLFVNAQAQPTKKEQLPAFTITLTSGNTFSNKNLVKNQPLMLMYFSPTCDHCKAFTKQLTDSIKSFSGKQIVMISYQPMDEIKAFEKTFDLTKYSNIKVGSESTTFTILKHFSIETLPFVALVNKAGELIKTIRNEPSVKAILKVY